MNGYTAVCLPTGKVTGLLQMKTPEPAVRNLLSRTGTGSPELALLPPHLPRHHSAPGRRSKPELHHVGFLTCFLWSCVLRLSAARLRMAEIRN